MLLKIEIVFVLTDVINVISVKQCQMFFAKLQDSYLFYPNSHQANNHEEVPYQPILWRMFSSVIDKNNKKFRIEIGKSITNLGLVLNHGKTR